MNQNISPSFCNGEINNQLQPSFVTIPKHQPTPSWFNNTQNALKLIGENIIDNPALFDPNASLLTKPTLPPLGENALNALKLIGQSIVDNPSLFDPTIPLPTKPSLLPLWTNTLDALKLIGQGIVDNQGLFDPTVPLPTKPTLLPLWTNTLDALKHIGQGIVDSPGLFDPNMPLPTRTFSPSLWVNQTLDALKLIGQNIVDNPRLFDPNPEFLTKPSWPSSWINYSLDGLKILGQEIINNPALFDPNDPLYITPLFSSNMSIKGTWPSYFQIGGINGMNTSEIEKHSHMTYLSNLAKDVSIDWVYNRTHGVPSDLLEIFTLNYNGISPNTEDLLTKNWTAFHEQNKDNPGVKYLQYCHSKGAIEVKNGLMKLPPEIRNRIICCRYCTCSNNS